MDKEVKIKNNEINSDQDYSARGIVARVEKCGEIQHGLFFVPLYRYITLDTGKGNRPQCAKLVGKAPMVEAEDGSTYLDISALKEGQIIVTPGLVYKKCEFEGILYAEHLKALQTYKPKTIIEAQAPPSGEKAIDLGTFDPDNVLKQ